MRADLRAVRGCGSCYRLGVRCLAHRGETVPNGRGYDSGCAACHLNREPCAAHRPLTDREADAEYRRETARADRADAYYRRLGFGR
jgi:hypothetical protein